jgi:hypothetical protein
VLHSASELFKSGIFASPLINPTLLANYLGL